MTAPSDDTQDLPPNVRRVLDLHVRHLPAGMVDELAGIEGVVATHDDSGAWVWVPDDVDEHFADYPTPPEELAFVLSYARVLGCDYVRFDADGDADTFLPMFDDE